MKLRVLVVDDSIIFRKVIRDCLAELDGVEVVDVAKNGQIALDKIRRLRPDIVTLDHEMPIMNGLEVLEAIQRESIPTHVIMVSSSTKQAAAATTRALEIGAFDFILKPDHSNPDENRVDLKRQLRQRLALLNRRNVGSSAIAEENRNYPATASSRAQPFGSSVASTKSVSPNQKTKRDVPSKLVASNSESLAVDAVCIGISTGGPKALGQLIPRLRTDFDVPILIVQHMPPVFTESLAKHLNTESKLHVVEAEHGMKLAAGTVAIAPGGKQMKVVGYPGAWKLSVTDDPPIRGCRPCVDYLFESASVQFGPRVLAIVMTGMGDDGTAGSASIVRRGGQVWVQDEASCTVYGMPRAVVKAGIPCDVRSPDGLADGLNLIRRGTQTRNAIQLRSQPDTFPRPSYS